MDHQNTKPERVKYYLLLALGFAGNAILGVSGLNFGAGFAAVVWILAFLYLSCEYPSKKAQLCSAAVFCASYLLRFMSAIEIPWLFFPLFTLIGLLQYGIFWLYSRILNRWNRLLTTLAFPAIWTVLYGLATLLRVPTLVRIDILFTDMSVLLQLEKLVGSAGMSFLIMWVLALFHYAVRRRRGSPAILASGLYLAALVIGVITLYPNQTYTDSVRVAYTTGPNVGDYIFCTALSAEEYLANMENAAEAAAAAGADILIFSEEAFMLDAAEEATLLERCSAAAGRYGIHMLVGLDLSSETEKSMNKIVWIDADGTVSGSYEKTKLIPVLESAYQTGDGVIPSHRITVDGRELTVSYLICYDSNFPLYVSRIPENTDILFLPSWDWSAVTELHGRLICALAAENRVSIMKCTYDGLSLVVNTDGKVIHSTHTDRDGFGTIQVTEIPLKGQAAEQGAMTGQVYGICAAEILSILVCIILLYGNVFENREKSIRNRLYSIITITCISGLVTDCGSWLLDGHVRMESLLYGTTILSMLLPFVLSGEFIVYLTAYIQERKQIRPVLQRIYMGFAMFAIVFTIFISCNGKLFTYENGTYMDGPWYGIYLVFNIVTVLLSMCAFGMYGKQMSNHDIAATGLYIAIPSVAAFINIFVPDFTYAYPASTLSLAVFYVMIQSERMGQLKKDEQHSSHMASHDELTGLPNRRAYDECLRSLSASTEKVGVVFTDVNGLKYANDNYGHEAGDRLLTEFSERLADCFHREDIFRISGDEFVVILDKCTRQVFEQRVARLKRSLMKNGSQIACIGVEYGVGQDVVKLLKQAESSMYRDKEVYHRAHPEMQRK